MLLRNHRNRPLSFLALGVLMGVATQTVHARRFKAQPAPQN